MRFDLTIGRRGEYSIRAALYLAEAWESGGASRTARHMAWAADLPASYAPQIARLLVRAGIVHARSGPRGGYRLAREPAAITLLQVVEAAETAPAARRCALRGGLCPREDACGLHVTWVRASEALRDVLERTTLADIVPPARVTSGSIRRPASQLPTDRRRPRRR